MKKKCVVKKHSRKYYSKGRMKTTSVRKHQRTYGGFSNRFNESLKSMASDKWGEITGKKYIDEFNQNVGLVNKEIKMNDSSVLLLENQRKNIEKKNKIFDDTKHNILSQLKTHNLGLDSTREELERNQKDSYTDFAKKQDLLKEGREVSHQLLSAKYNPQFEEIKSKIAKLNSLKKEGIQPINVSGVQMFVAQTNLDKLKADQVKTKNLHGKNAKDIMKLTVLMKQEGIGKDELKEAKLKKNKLRRQTAILDGQSARIQSDLGSYGEQQKLLLKVQKDNAQTNFKNIDPQLAALELEKKAVDYKFENELAELDSKHNQQDYNLNVKRQNKLDTLISDADKKILKHTKAINDAKNLLKNIDVNKQQVRLDLNQVEFNRQNALQNARINKFNLLNKKQELETNKDLIIAKARIMDKFNLKEKNRPVPFVKNVMSADV